MTMPDAVADPPGEQPRAAGSSVGPPPVHRAPSLLRNAAHLMSSQVITWVLATAVQVMIPTFLGPAGLGQLRLATSVWAMGTIFVQLGTNRYLRLEIARDRERGLELVGPVIGVRLLAFGALTLALVVTGAVGRVSGATAAVFVAIGASVLIDTVSETWSSALIGMEEVPVTARVGIVAKLAYTVAVVGVLLAGGGPAAVGATMIVGSVVTFLLLHRAFRRFGRTDLTNAVRRGLPVARASLAFLAMAATLVVYQQIDTVVLSALVDAESLGWYSTADTLFGTLLFIPVITITVLLPRLGRLHQQDPAELRRLSQQAFGTQALIAVPIGLGALVVANRLVLMLFGDEYRESGPVLAVYGVVLIITCGTILLGGIASATERARQWNYVMVGAIVLSIPLDLVLVPWTDRRYDNGAIGGALAYVVTEVGIIVAGLRWFAPYLVTRSTVTRLAKILVAGGAMLAATWPLRDHLFLAVAVGAVVYPVAVLAVRALDEHEWQMVRRGLGRLRR